MKISLTSFSKACFRFFSLVLAVGGLFVSAQAQALVTANGHSIDPNTNPVVAGTTSFTVADRNFSGAGYFTFSLTDLGGVQLTNFSLACAPLSISLVNNDLNWLDVTADNFGNVTGFSLNASTLTNSVVATLNTSSSNGTVTIVGRGTVNDLTTSITSSIPEPSTYAAIFGALALGAAAYRRCRARA